MLTRKSAAAILCAIAVAFSITAADATQLKHGQCDNDGRCVSFDLSARKKHVRSVSLKGIISVELIAKTQEIVSKCGSVVVSARSRRGYRSNHPIGRAVDIRGNPKCIYEQLAGWPGGVSTDYSSAPGGPHVHVSYNPGGQEWGLRFRHNHALHRHPNTVAAVTTDHSSAAP